MRSFFVRKRRILKRNVIYLSVFEQIPLKLTEKVKGEGNVSAVFFAMGYI